MTELVFTFETDPQVGVPRLLPVTGKAPGWTSREVQQFEDLLRSKYEAIARDGSAALPFKSTTLTVRRQAGDTSRQPTLEVYASAPAPTPGRALALFSPRPRRPPPRPAPTGTPTGWRNSTA
ncbi:MAG: hypothetical protein K2V38_13220, partial [Gemmataceae bacterium]|nr:hypothetical protein [Gemmataceae bacterium]